MPGSFNRREVQCCEQARVRMHKTRIEYRRERDVECERRVLGVRRLLGFDELVVPGPRVQPSLLRRLPPFDTQWGMKMKHADTGKGGVTVVLV